jgi:lipopolysaccharide biosynthesis glycosyltransferase
MIHITTAANENYAPGLLVTVASMLVSIDPEVEVTLYFLNGGVSPSTMEKLKRMCKSLHSYCALINIPLDEKLFAGANLGPGNSYMAYARLLMGSLIKSEKVIYIDSDMVVLRDLAKIWSIDMQGSGVLACVDRKLTTLQHDCPLDLNPEEKTRPYFNSGFIVADLNRWRELKIDDRSLEFSKSFHCPYADQTVLNYLFRNDFLPLDPNWNWQAYNICADHKLIKANLHFIEKLKPWLYCGSNLKHCIWRLYYSKYVGSLLLLYISKNGIRALFLGIKERLIRWNPIFRNIYFDYLRSKNIGKDEVEVVIKFYGNDSLKIPYGKESQLLKEFKDLHFSKKLIQNDIY